MKKRGAGKNITKYKLRDVYKWYIDNTTIKQLTSSYADSTEISIPYKKYKEVVEAYLKKIVHLIIEESGIFYMPYRMGALRVVKKKMKVGKLLEHNKLKLNYKIFNTTGKKVYHLNDHRRGYSYSAKWDKRGSGKVVYKKLYKYVPTRTINRRLAWILQNDFSKDYFE